MAEPPRSMAIVIPVRSTIGIGFYLRSTEYSVCWSLLRELRVRKAGSNNSRLINILTWHVTEWIRRSTNVRSMLPTPLQSRGLGAVLRILRLTCTVCYDRCRKMSVSCIASKIDAVIYFIDHLTSWKFKPYYRRHIGCILHIGAKNLSIYVLAFSRLSCLFCSSHQDTTNTDQVSHCFSQASLLAVEETKLLILVAGFYRAHFLPWLLNCFFGPIMRNLC